MEEKEKCNIAHGDIFCKNNPRCGFYVAPTPKSQSECCPNWPSCNLNPECPCNKFSNPNCSCPDCHTVPTKEEKVEIAEYASGRVTANGVEVAAPNKPSWETLFDEQFTGWNAGTFAEIKELITRLLEEAKAEGAPLKCKELKDGKPCNHTLTCHRHDKNDRMGFKAGYAKGLKTAQTQILEIIKNKIGSCSEDTCTKEQVLSDIASAIKENK